MQFSFNVRHRRERFQTVPYYSSYQNGFPAVYRREALRPGKRRIRPHRFDPHLHGPCVKSPMFQSRLFQEAPTLLEGIGRLNRFYKSSSRFRMLSKKGFPKKIKKSDENEGGIPMKVNYNKRSPFLQGSGNLVEEVNRAF
jgi:hypothetical protein